MEITIFFCGNFGFLVFVFFVGGVVIKIREMGARAGACQRRNFPPQSDISQRVQRFAANWRDK